MKHFSIFLLLMGSSTLLAQVANKTANLIPQTPNNASLFKSVETPVTYYNGTSAVTIPIYEITLGNFKLPIFLSYHTGGIKINEESSYVGLGWALSASGTISQSIVGTNDLYETGFIDVDYMQHTIMPNRPLGGVDLSPRNVIERGVCYPDAAGVMHKYEFEPGGLFFFGSSNREYDLYVYNFGNHSGKLINPKLNFYEDKFVSLDNNNIQFSLTGSFESGSLKAITPDGTQYLFNDLEHTLYYNSLGTAVHSYSRHLTSLTTVEGRVINFTYKSVSTNLISPPSQSYFSHTVGSQGGLEWVDSRSIAPSTTGNILYLDEITWDNGVIKFDTDGLRDDVAGGLKLNSIEVYNTSNTLIKKAQFTYDYFIGNIKYGDYYNVNHGGFAYSTVSSLITESVRSKRLKLLSVKIDDMPPYSFDYNPGEMPYKTAFAKDMWDYFNGVDFNQMTGSGFYKKKYSFLPNPSYMGYYDAAVTASMISLPGINFGDRHPNENAMQIGTLARIEYPSGGYTAYEYEANRFAPPDGVATNIGMVGKILRDGNVTGDVKQYEFIVPTVNQFSNINLGTIFIRLSCGCLTGTNDNACYPYSAANVNTSNQSSVDGLYIVIEQWNGSSWTRQKTWDFADPDIVHGNGIFNTTYNFLQGEKYRITANYPDREECVSDMYGNRVALITLSYYDFVTGSNADCIGGGIRIKSIRDFTKDNQLSLTRKLTYSGGILTTKPSFIRFVNNAPFTYRAKDCFNLATDPCVGCDETGDIFPVYAPGTTIPTDPHFFSGYYAEPTTPYSYSASGSVVGYSKVIAEYIGDAQNGKTEYAYSNRKDIVLNNNEAAFFGQHPGNMNFELGKLPGIPPIKDPLNGMLVRQSVFKKEITGYQEIQRTDYSYDVVNKKTYWAYKLEYAYAGMGSVGLSVATGTPLCAALVAGTVGDLEQCAASAGTYVNFYPVTIANVNLTNKIEQKHMQDGNYVESTIAYSYNARNQMWKEVTTSSRNKIISQETYFVPQRQFESSVLVEMQNRNMLDYPVEDVTKDITPGQGKELYRKKTNYQYWNGTTLIAPGIEQSSVKGKPLQTDITYNTLDNKGNVLQYTGKDGVAVCYVWGYKQTYPIAKITNATYSNVLSALGQTDPNLPYIQSMDNTTLVVELTKLRNNLAVSAPGALVSSYLYGELIGIAKEIDPNGRKITYEYDSSNRLKIVKDNDENVIRTFEYKYFGQ